MTTRSRSEFRDLAAVLVHESRDLADEAESLIGRYDRLVQADADVEALAVVLGPLEATPEHRRAIAWATDKPRRFGILALFGTVGSGKTVAAMHYALLSGASVLHASAAGLAPFHAHESIVARYSKPDALVIDEVGGHGSRSGPAAAVLGAIISRRRALRRPTVLTGNFASRKAFAEYFDGEGADGETSRILDRIADGGEWVEFRRASMRGKTKVEPGEPSRVVTMRRHLGLVTHAKLVMREDATTEPDARLLGELQELLGITDAEVLACAERRSRFLTEIVDDLRERTSSEAIG